MFNTSEASSSNCANLNTFSNNVGDSDLEIDDMEGIEDVSSLWCVEDDFLFYAQGLKHHSAGKGKSVYVTWNENYLLNFVFKTSIKTGKTTLTKVRIPLPVYDQQLEEISNMLILEMNTLLCMKGGRVYYFSSVKSMHKIDWLTGVRCITTCPLTQFSVIRSLCHHDGYDMSKRLCLEVYKDVPQLGKCHSNKVLSHRYDISFDLDNIFNCDWLEETYTLTSLISNENNIAFLKQLVSVGNIFRSQQEITDVNMNQEIHIFTISGNMFILVGAIASEGESVSSNPQVEEFNIRLLNAYASSIKCTQIDCENNLLIVLLQSGHMDIWYKSKRTFGAVFHCQHEISYFLDYDYCPAKNIFYFTTPEEVLELKIITRNRIGVEEECTVKETRKYISGMIACTFVEEMEQLICISVNNIFYRINFPTIPEAVEVKNENETKYQNFNNLYALNSKRLNDLMAKAQIINELLEHPKYLHNAIEIEFQKQQVLAVESKSEIIRKLFQCHLEYHVYLPGFEYFNDDCVQVKIAGHPLEQSGAKTIYCLIFMNLKNNKNNFLSSIFTAKMWYLHITNHQQCMQLHVPFEILSKKLCFIIGMKQHAHQVLPTFSLNLLTFLDHQCHPINLRFKLKLDTSEKTYCNLFNYNGQNLQIFRNSFNDIQTLLIEHSNRTHYTFNSIKMECDENVYKFKHRYQIPKTLLLNIMEKIKINSSWRLNTNFKMYYLHQYLIDLNYDDRKEILLICSNYPMAIFYIKLLLYSIQAYNSLDIIDISVHNTQQILLNCQNDVESLYGLLESGDINSNTASIHLENLQIVHLKLRNEFCDILR